LTTPHRGHPVYQPAAKHRSLSPVCVSHLCGGTHTPPK
jgi:hypothetical protein